MKFWMKEIAQLPYQGITTTLLRRLARSSHTQGAEEATITSPPDKAVWMLVKLVSLIILGLSVINEKIIIKTTEQLYFQCLTMCFVVIRKKTFESQRFQRIPKTSNGPDIKAEVSQIMVHEVIGTVPTQIVALILQYCS